MEYVTIIGRTYEDAVKKGRKLYGSAMRIHSRRDISVRGGFLWLGKKKRVEIICYLVGTSSKVEAGNSDALLKEFEEEAQTPDPRTLGKKQTEDSHSAERKPSVPPVAEKAGRTQELTDHIRRLLILNDFSDTYIQKMLDYLGRDSDGGSVLEMDKPAAESALVNQIMATMAIDRVGQTHPAHNYVLLGPTGVGKTTTIAKLAAIFGVIPPPEERRSVAIITLDSYRVGAREQIFAFADALNLPAHQAHDENELFSVLDSLEGTDLVLIDTIGRSPRDNELSIKLTSLLSIPTSESTAFYLCIGASMKKADIEDAVRQTAPFSLRGLIITKLDETRTVGNFISLAAEKSLPLTFVTDGQKISDIHPMSHSLLLQRLQGFSIPLDTAGLSQLKAVPSL
ncbi:GTP-binding signal recognition particle SRP54 G- domain-containing protein [Parasphaerochaeta coccoides]|uniref:Flagellar biosynthesis protein FlhF n=1 Tax=Parasphaerochaeta coccoides (strain ATCC BAA-1237 / DSM 17374 / SPN1) TaxID=760011 RepID=F4GKV7_PARC1|nr:GTP-binding signal recognition particle SRP54 G- domain-containing protein [Parasphaerochaeta coccoides]AEC01870.1 GTP-binding signal recognition particle SRP54 G- domain protein [Parasphaerochaeta coccoides DSM 17374]